MMPCLSGSGREVSRVEPTQRIIDYWLLDRDIANLSNIHADYQFNGKSGVDATDRILPGRPQAGVAIAWRKRLSHYV